MTAGDVLAGRFTLLEAIGAGGATTAWLAQDGETGGLVVLRVLAEPLAASAESLRDACLRARGLVHPNVARVFDFHRTDDVCFVSREYVEGVGVSTLAGRPRADVLAAMVAVASALEAAHAAGIVHGDLKATKVLRDFSGAVRVVDFGLEASLREAARAAGISAEAGGGSSPWGGAGTPPEPGDDVFALGRLLHETLGRARDGGDAPAALMELVDAMRAQDPSARPGDLGRIRRALENLVRLGSVDPAAPAEALPRVRLSSRHQGATDRKPRNAWYAAGLAVLGVLALFVVFVLPRWLERSEPALEAPSSESESETAAPAAGVAREEEGAAAPRDDANAKAEAQDLLARLVPLRESLQERAAERWAAVELEAALAAERAGDAALFEKRHPEARDRYAEALAGLEGIEGRLGDVLAENLRQGHEALEQADGDAAREHFERAQAIDPDDPEAAKGLGRVDRLADVLRLVSEARKSEAAGQTEAALVSFTEALEIDPEWRPAEDGLRRTRERHEAESYDRALSAALVALGGRDFATARKRFKEARALRPGASEVTAGMRQLEQAETSDAIARRRSRAEAAEAAERWSEAVEHYRAILQIEGQLAFAREGLERSEELARMSRRMDDFLTQPRQLFSAPALNEARLLVEAADRVSSGRPALAERARNLKTVMRLATTPIPVEFRSDSATEVVIRRVGSLGSFERRDVPLKPGDYVVVGQRDGYRDVRREISVVPGTSPPVVDVRCTDRI